LRTCIFDWFGTSRILCTTEEILDPILILCCYLVGNMVVKVSGTAVLHLTVNVFNNTFNNISVISWRSVLLVEETGVSGENHRPDTSHWQTLSHNVASSTTRHDDRVFYWSHKSSFHGDCWYQTRTSLWINRWLISTTIIIY